MKSEHEGDDFDVQVIQVHKKPPRNRGATWTDGEVRKLFYVWGQPKILKGFVGRRRKQELFKKMTSELSKIGVQRTAKECRAKIKNLKGEFRRAKEQHRPKTFRFYSLMEKLNKPRGEPDGNNATTISNTRGKTFKNDDEDDEEDDDEDDEDTEISNMLLRNMNDETDSEDESDYDARSSDELDATSPSHQQQNNSLEASLVEPHHSQHNNHHQVNQPVQIEFELMSNVDFQTMKGSQLPIEIEGDSILIPHEYATNIDAVNNTTTTVFTHQQPTLTNHQAGISFLHHPEASSSTGSFTNRAHNASESSGTKVPLSAREISQKRRKLNTIGEKMAHTVSSILTQTTNSLIEEMKASEERFMKWEEKRREEDRKREEQMLKRLVEAIRTSPSSSNDNHRRFQGRSSEYTAGSDSQNTRRIHEMMNSSEDPCAVAFDVLATNLTTKLTEQSKKTEEEFQDWEERMRLQETKHTDNLFQMLLNAVSSSKNTNHTVLIDI